MKKKLKKNPKIESLSPNDLSPLVKDLEAVTPSVSTFQRVVVFLVPLLIGLVLLSPLSPIGKRILDRGVFQGSSYTSWTEESFINLELRSTEEEVVATFGPPDERESYSTDTVILTYNFNEGEGTQFVKLTFSGRLENKFAYGMETTALDHIKSSQKDYQFTTSDIDELKVGDSYTGLGGASLEEVVTRYGHPTEASAVLYEESSSIYNSRKGLEKTLYLTYQQSASSPYDWVILTFSDWDDGGFHLSSKDTY